MQKIDKRGKFTTPKLLARGWFKPFRPELSGFNSCSREEPALKLCLGFRPQSSCSTPPSTPVQQRSSLADDITVVGGNGTGIFVSHVRHGSVAEQCGLKEGSELLEVCVINNIVINM